MNDIFNTFTQKAQALAYKFGLYRKTVWKIAILMPTYHVLVKPIIKGFIKTLLEQKHQLRCYSLDNFVGHNDVDSPRKNAEYAVKNDYDLIFTLGEACTKAAIDSTKLQENPIPVVFCGFRDPWKYKIISGNRHTLPNNVTGIIMEEDHHIEQAKVFSHMLPKAKSVIIAANVSFCLALKESRQRVVSILHSNNIDAFVINIANQNDIAHKIEPHLSSKNVDGVIILRDNLILEHIDELVYLCNKYKTPLCASDWYAVEKGATMGYGFSEEITGSNAASKVLQILEKDIPPSLIPITCPNYSYKCKVNRDCAEELGIMSQIQNSMQKTPKNFIEFV